MEMICSVAGCGQEASQLAPDPRGRDDSLTQLVEAPISWVCSAHADIVSDLYARAVARALFSQHRHGTTVEIRHVQAVCDQLREMHTDIAQSTYAILGRIRGIE